MQRLQVTTGHTPAPTERLVPVSSARGAWWGILAAVIAAAVLLLALWSRARAPGEASVGVLPFENRSGDSAQAYLSDGVSDELTARLSAIPELKVSPRSSTIRFRASQEAPDEIGKQLGVTYLLTGGVARHGDSVRVSVELIDAPARTPALERGAGRAGTFPRPPGG